MTAKKSASMKRIARLVGLPPAYLKGMYGDLVDRFEALIRSGHLDIHTDDMLDYALLVSERALNIRQTYLLPENAPPEIVARKSDQWTYGVFLAAFLHDLDQVVTAPEELARTATSLVPKAALDWLASEPDLMTAWLAVVTGDRDRSNVIGKIVMEAVCQLGGDESSADAEDPDSSLDLVMGLRQLIGRGQLSMNCIEGDAWVTEGDLWLSSKEGLNKLRSWIIDRTDASGLQNNELLDQLQAENLCLPTPEKNRAVWTMTIKENDQQKRVSVIRLPIDIICPDAAERPSSFDGEILLRNRNETGVAA